MKKFVLGVDVGGTNIKMGIVSSSGKIFARTNLVTKSYIRNKNELIEAVIKSIRCLLAEHNLQGKNLVGIGMGLPGLINSQEGIVKFLPNIPNWRNVPLKKIFEKKIKVPTYIENDVNLITLGEWKFGAGMGARNLICMTLGTGVGGGLILDDNLYRGEGFVAGEIGHMPLNEKGPKCNCGGFGCFERYVGNRYLQEKAAKIFKKKNITLEEVTALATQGNKKAVQFWEETAAHIGNALTGVVNVLNPTRIVIGGGVSNSYRFLVKTIERTIKTRAMKVQAAMVKIVRAKLGDDAGLIGAQVLVSELARIKGEGKNRKL